MAQQQHEYTPTYLTPVRCQCGGSALLTRRSPLDQEGSAPYREHRIFHCDKCGNDIEMVVED